MGHSVSTQRRGVACWFAMTCGKSESHFVAIVLSTSLIGDVCRPLVGDVAARGTYTVNPNCTGTAVMNTPNSPVPLHLAFVVVRHG
jgi:hypothetical protein